MPVHIYWGEDDFLLSKAVEALRAQHLDREWGLLNYIQIAPADKDNIANALVEIATAPLGEGGKIVHLPQSSLLGACPLEVIAELEKTLPNIPENNILLITSAKKPDERNKSVKLILQYAQLKTFPIIPQWESTKIVSQVKSFASSMGVKLTNDAVAALVEAVGNNSRQAWNELEKLKLYAGDAPIDAQIIKQLVANTFSSSLQLAAACRIGDPTLALKQLDRLLALNEPPLRIVATLATCFRTWLSAKACIEAGWKDDAAIAKFIELKNPKRLFFIKQEIRAASLIKLKKAMAILLELEVLLKSGGSAENLAIYIIELCTV